MGLHFSNPTQPLKVGKFTEMEKLYSPKEAGKLLGITPQTIRLMDKSGKLRCVRTSGNKRRVPESEIRRLLGESVQRKLLIYARVSSHDQKQKGDLQRQADKLNEDFSKEFQDIEVITDVGSGLSEKRKGLQKLFKLVIAREITDVGITYEDRLTRFGFKYLQPFFESYGVKIHILNENDKKSIEQELTDDLIAIITSFSGKLYGLRSHKTRKIRESVKKALKKSD